MHKKCYAIALLGIIGLLLLTGCQDSIQNEKQNVDNNLVGIEGTTLWRIKSVNDESITIIPAGKNENKEMNIEPPSGENGLKDMPAEMPNDVPSKDELDIAKSNSGDKPPEKIDDKPDQKNDIEKTFNFTDDVKIVLSDGSNGSAKDLKEDDMISITLENELVSSISVQNNPLNMNK